MLRSNSAKSLRAADLTVKPADRPGWEAGGARPPVVGEAVYCVAGEGVVKSVHGKTSDGSRLLQIQLATDGAPPYFAAASNVLFAPA